MTTYNTAQAAPVELRSEGREDGFVTPALKAATWSIALGALVCFLLALFARSTGSTFPAEAYLWVGGFVALLTFVVLTGLSFYANSEIGLAAKFYLAQMELHRLRAEVARLESQVAALQGDNVAFTGKEKVTQAAQLVINNAILLSDMSIKNGRGHESVHAPPARQ